jgi:hypothetical protein
MQIAVAKGHVQKRTGQRILAIKPLCGPSPLHVETSSPSPYCPKHFKCPESLLPVCVLLSFSVLPCQNALQNASRTAANDSDAK